MSVVTPKITDQLPDARAPRSIVDELFKSRNIDVTDLEQLPSVVFSPGDGSGVPQDVELSVPGHSDATIYYTTNGLVPSIQNPPYSTALKIDRGTTILAVAVKTGYAPSPISSADYLEQGQLAPPTFSPGAGSTGPTAVTLSGPTGASIYYTTDGSTPTASSTLYAGPVGIGGNEVIKAISVKSGSKTSVVASAHYVFEKLPDVTFSPEGGAVPASVTLSMPSHPLATIYYSTADFDCGPGPQSSYQVYSSPISVNDPSYIYAYAVLSGYQDSDHKAVKYADTLPNVSFSTTSGGVLTPNAVSMSVSGFADADVDIYYTTDGTDPTTSSTKYDAAYPPFFPSGDIGIKAKAVKCGYSDGPVTSFSLVAEINLPEPTFTPVSGSEMPGTAGTIVISVPGYPTASIYYTLDGSTPTTADTLYTAALDATIQTYPLTVKAVAFTDGVTGPVGTATYDVSRAAAPTFTPDSGNAELSVTITTNEAGGTTRYTTDGTEPTESSTIYTGAISITEQTTLKARTFKAGFEGSLTTSALYGGVLVPVDMHATRYEDAAYQNTFGLYTVLDSVGTYAAIGSLDPFGNTSMRAMALDPTDNTTYGITDTKETTVSLEGTDGIIVMVSQANQDAFFTSYDGEDWTLVENNPFSGENIGEIAFGDGKFVLVTQSGSVATSTDLQTWTPTGNHMPNWPGGAFLNELKWIDSISMFVMLTGGTGIGRTSFVSPDGINWTPGNQQFGTNNGYGLVEGNGVIVTMEHDNASIGPPQPWYSLDGLNWSTGTATGGNWAMHDIAYGNGKFVAVGISRVGITPSTPGNVMTSSDGTTWSETSGIASTRPSTYVPGVAQVHLQGVVHNGNTFVAVGGEHLSTVATPPPFERYAAAYESTDAVTWTQVFTTSDASQLPLVRGVWNGSRWVFPGAGVTVVDDNAVPTSMTDRAAAPNYASWITTAASGSGTPSISAEFPTRYTDPASPAIQSIKGHYDGITTTDGTLSVEVVRAGTQWTISNVDHAVDGEFSGSVAGDGGDVIPIAYTDGSGNPTNVNLRLPQITRQIVTVDVETGDTTSVASIDVEVTAAAIDSGGVLYAAGFETQGVPALYTINKSSGVATRLGNVVGNTIGESFNAVEGLGFNESGTLMGVLERSDGKSVVRQIPTTPDTSNVVTRISANERFVYTTWDKSGAAAIGDTADIWNNLATHNGFGTLDLVDVLGNATGAAYYTEDNGTGSAAWSQSTGGGNPTSDVMMGSRKQVSAGGDELATTIVGVGEGTYDFYWYGGDSPTRQPQKVTLSVVESGGGATSYGQKTVDTTLSGALWTEDTHYARYTNVVLNNADDAIRLVSGSGSLSQFAGFQIQSNGTAEASSSIIDVSIPATDLVSDPYARDLVFANGNFHLFNSGNAIDQIDQDVQGTLDPISNSFDLRTGSKKAGLEPVTFSPVDGSTYPTSVTLSTLTGGATIYYTTDGSNPKTSGTVQTYSSPVSITTTRTIRAYASLGDRDSEITQASYVAVAGQVSPVTFDPDNGATIDGSLVITMTTATDGASIYYSTDPSDTSDPSTLYTGPITITENTTFKAMATKGGMTNSVKTSATYGELGDDEVEFFYLDQDFDRAGPWGVFTSNGATDFHFAIYFNLDSSTTVDRLFITIQPNQANITNATNASPIVITTDADHGMGTGEYVHVYDCEGNTAANGEWQITRLSATSFSLNGSTGNGSYTGSGKFAGGGGHTSDTTVDGSQTWDTEKSIWYPIVVYDADDTKLNSAYGTTFGPFTGLTRLDGYGQIVSIPGSYFTLWVVLSDGRTLLKTINF